MIPIVKESKEITQAFGYYERCYFCQLPTNTWHCRTNQPVCKDCSKKHKVSELPKCTPNYKPKTRKEYMK